MELHNFKAFTNNTFSQAPANWAKIKSDQELLPKYAIKNDVFWVWPAEIKFYF